MLTDLHVRDLGVIEDLRVQFGPGMTVLTGETGAGKTLLVEALQLVLGGRASSGLVRSGSTETLIDARFLSIDAETGTGAGTGAGAGAGAGAGREDGRQNEGPEIILARSLPADGRSRAWIDGRMAPVGRLHEAGLDLVDIHGQHEHQTLLSPGGQRKALDEFSGADLGPRRLARRRLSEIDAAIEALGGDDQQRARDADILRHQITEIDAAEITDPGEDHALAAEESRLADLSAHRDMAAFALDLLNGDSASVATSTSDRSQVADVDSVVALVGRAVTALGDRPAFSAWHARLASVAAEAGDIATDLREVVDTWEDDPERLAAVQERRRLLADLRRKYGAGLIDVLAFAEDARTRLLSLDHAAEEGARLASARTTAIEDLDAAEIALGNIRREHAAGLGDAVTSRLGTLAMTGARFDVFVGEDAAADEVRFLLGANVGEDPQPISRVASGGELARTMLALRLVAMGGPATMVFDEVDAGVGGAAALALATALREVAEDRQVLVVTHLAQVAAFADHQILVEKRMEAGRTVTTARELNRSERVVEISRMLSGHPGSTTARAHAEELLETAHTATPGAARVDAGRSPDVGCPVPSSTVSGKVTKTR